MNQNKFAITAVTIILLAAIFVIYIYKSAPRETNSDIDTNTSADATVPKIDTVDVGTVPDVNPAANSNPLRKVKTNPFD